MAYNAVRYESSNDAMAAFRRMIERKQAWVERTERELEELALFRQAKTA